ncbi:MAG: DUF3035 domain-containing protein [Alphaproteobacteria bacterium]
MRAFRSRAASFALLGLASGLLLGACSRAENVQDALGYEQKGPDEMAVIKRPPLILPPDYNLRPPRSDDHAAASQNASESARATLLGQDAAGANGTPPDDGAARALLTNGAATAAPSDAASEGQSLLVSRTDRTELGLDQLAETRKENRVDTALLRRLLAWTPEDRAAPAEGADAAAGDGQAPAIRVVSRAQTLIDTSPAPQDQTSAAGQE